MRAIFGYLQIAYPKKYPPLKVCYLGLFYVGLINSPTLSFEKSSSPMVEKVLEPNSPWIQTHEEQFH